MSGRSRALDGLLVRRGGYVPTFAPSPGGPGDAMLRIVSRQLDELAERVGQAPDKRGFALLDLVGVAMVSATASRTPIVFQPTPGVDHVSAPAGTRVGAMVASRPAPVVFETERTITIAGARLVEIASVVPGKDAYTSHVADLGAAAPVTLFDAVTPFAHELYLAHSEVFPLSGRATVELLVALSTPSTTPLTLSAEWWDGKQWRTFAPFADPAGDEDSRDGTVGLTRGGTIRLVSPCADSKPTAVRGLTSSWLRLRVTSPLASPTDPGASLPVVEQLRVRTVVERRRVAQHLRPSITNTLRLWSAEGAPVAGHAVSIRDVTAVNPVTVTTNNAGSVTLPLQIGATFQLALGAAPTSADWLPQFRAAGPATAVDLVLQRGVLPDKAMSDGRVLDATKSFAPLGPNPEPGAALYLACDEIATRPGATVAMELHRPVTAQEEADAQGSRYEIEINAAIALVHQIEADLTAIANKLDALRIAKDINGLDVAAGPIGAPLPSLLNEPTTDWYTRLKTNITTLVNAVGRAATVQIEDLLDLIGDIIGGLFGGDDEKRQEAQRLAASTTISVALALEALGANDPILVVNRVNLQTALSAATIDYNVLNATRIALQAAIAVVVSNPSIFMAGTFPPFLTMRPEDFVTHVSTRLAQATTEVMNAANSIRTIVTQLVSFNPALLVAANGGIQPKLSPAVVAWEYWNGDRWAPLPGLGAPIAGATPVNLQASGVVRFTVPDGWASVDVAGDARRWMRARLASGHYSRLRLVAWTDAESNLVNFLPVVEPRPPTLDRVEFTFRRATEPVTPEQITSFDDAEWRDHRGDLATPNVGFQPFRACRDGAPTLYLGFDAPLPAASIGIFVEVEERPGGRPTPLRFEAWDGTAYRRVVAEDGTRGLTTSGIVHLVWPGDSAGAPSLVVRAADTSVTLGEAGAELRYPVGAALWLADGRGGELVEVAGRAVDELQLSRPVSRAYAGGVIRAAPPARFARPLTFLRILLDADSDPPPVTIRGVAPNSVFAANVESVAAEVVGGSDGTPGLVALLRRSPVLEGELVEVRELSGPRAAIDAPILHDELAAVGRANNLRVERDPVTGAVTAAWVRWQARDTLAFSGGDARDYVIDRGSGRLLFGDGRFGRIVPAGTDNIIATYRAGSATPINLPPRSITNVLSGVLAREVTNPLPADGAAPGEQLPALRSRGPGILRHRHQALSAADYEALALEASAGVARARALGAVDDVGRPTVGVVRVVIVPASSDTAPMPTPELRRLVADHILARAPLTLGGSPSISVTGPRYTTVGVQVGVQPSGSDMAASVRDALTARIAEFLHPLTGGDGSGFAFGARLATSDLARIVATMPGVDAVIELAFTADAIGQGDIVRLAPDCLPTAGLITVQLLGGE